MAICWETLVKLYREAYDTKHMQRQLLLIQQDFETIPKLTQFETELI